MPVWKPNTYHIQKEITQTKSNQREKTYKSNRSGSKQHFIKTRNIGLLHLSVRPVIVLTYYFNYPRLNCLNCNRQMKILRTQSPHTLLTISIISVALPFSNLKAITTIKNYPHTKWILAPTLQKACSSWLEIINSFGKILLCAPPAS